MSSLFYILSLAACVATATVGACLMRWRMQRVNNVSDREDPRDTQIRNLLGEVQMARNDMSRSQQGATDAAEHVQLAHERIEQLFARNTKLTQQLEATAGERSGTHDEIELLKDNLSAVNKQIETLKQRNQELEVELRAANDADMLETLQQEEDTTDTDEIDHIEALVTPLVNETSPSLLESLTTELERWKKHCQVLGDELKIQRERLAQLGESTESDENPFDSIDELTDIRGIGNAIARKLHQLGVYRYRELASLSGDDCERARMLIANFDSRMQRDDWQEQARNLHREKYQDAL
jgi:predicted flap endonuclease-1-like 5' DNA nuclease